MVISQGFQRLGLFHGVFQGIILLGREPFSHGKFTSYHVKYHMKMQSPFHMVSQSYFTDFFTSVKKTCEIVCGNYVKYM